jgi:CMP-N-acetylneuraminic acid synthetase
VKKVCVIPARLGSQRLKKKNLLTINNKSLVNLCAEKCISSGRFDEVYINSESDEILDEAPYGCLKYKRRKDLANGVATSEDFIRDFLQNIECDYLFQIHTIAPLLTKEQIGDFVDHFIDSEKQVGFSCEKIILESLLGNRPINFSFEKKENSQDLKNIHIINWAMTAWKNDVSLLEEECLSFGTTRYFYEIPRTSSIVIKTKQDYVICKKIMEK